MKTTREQRAAWRSSVEGRDDLPRIPPIPSDYLDMLHAFIDTGKGDRMMLVADLNAALKPQAGGEIVARLRQAEARVEGVPMTDPLTNRLDSIRSRLAELCSPSMWRCLFAPSRGHHYLGLFQTAWCRYRGHPAGVWWYNTGGLEPNMHCKNCGDDLG